MANETIEGLRAHLFATLAALRDPEKPMEVERARAVADVASKIIESAKVEVSYMKEVGGKGSGFIPEAPRRAALEAPTNGAGRRQ